MGDLQTKPGSWNSFWKKIGKYTEIGVVVCAASIGVSAFVGFPLLPNDVTPGVSLLLTGMGINCIYSSLKAIYRTYESKVKKRIQMELIPYTINALSYLLNIIALINVWKKECLFSNYISIAFFGFSSVMQIGIGITNNILSGKMLQQIMNIRNTKKAIVKSIVSFTASLSTTAFSVMASAGIILFSLAIKLNDSTFMTISGIIMPISIACSTISYCIQLAFKEEPSSLRQLTAAHLSHYQQPPNNRKSLYLHPLPRPKDQSTEPGLTDPSTADYNSTAQLAPDSVPSPIATRLRAPSPILLTKIDGEIEKVGNNNELDIEMGQQEPLPQLQTQPPPSPRNSI